MKLLIPISYFFGNPKSELWQLDTETKKRSLLATLPSSERDVAGKGLTSVTWISNDLLVGCDFNRVFIIDRKLCELKKINTDEQFNDLHHVSFDGHFIHIANTGRDCVDVLDNQLQSVSRIEFLPIEEISSRVKGEYKAQGDYYDCEAIKIDFHLRKVPDSLHINHVIRVGKELANKVIVTSFKKKCLVDAKTLEPLSNNLPEQPHDGFIDNKYIWITTVSGKVFRSKLSLPFNFELFFDLFRVVKFKGWCRGLLVANDTLFIGVTAIHKENNRTNWLNSPVKNTRTGVYQINLASLNIEHFYDFSHTNGSRIFSIISDYFDG
ncbi:hypothetical protein HJP15_10430 [Pseudoalteromonas sp. NEC-BIFX-2020_002]|uniref:hypothetical protein n=1 Tax=Pseudoalteromonas sp. NEC-BIFX-2020_002 TaxID=2732353 RepID=UPI001476AE27|nr:hypothetical protein [Pseudoalteromonas sp. NEC-BIFX-2020_002]NNG43324.1 hypothetical protein [Pseudoalteromonas sp. NEC-BIFX-2020_002]